MNEGQTAATITYTIEILQPTTSSERVLWYITNFKDFKTPTQRTSNHFSEVLTLSKPDEYYLVISSISKTGIRARITIHATKPVEKLLDPSKLNTIQYYLYKYKHAFYVICGTLVLGGLYMMIKPKCLHAVFVSTTAAAAAAVVASTSTASVDTAVDYLVNNAADVDDTAADDAADAADVDEDDTAAAADDAYDDDAAVAADDASEDTAAADSDSDSQSPAVDKLTVKSAAAADDDSDSDSQSPAAEKLTVKSAAAAVKSTTADAAIEPAAVKSRSSRKRNTQPSIRIPSFYSAF